MSTVADRPPEVIAEAGVNHNGEEGLARQLVEAAHAAGASAVKFQTFDPDELAAASAPTAGYQAAAGQGDAQAEMLRRLVLDRAALTRLWRHAEGLGLPILSTPFDIDSARFLVGELGMDRIKVGSGELTNLPLIIGLARLGRPLMLSTGMADLHEVRRALDAVAFGALAGPADRPSLAALAEAGRSPDAAAIRARTVVFQCTTQYPAPVGEANLRVLRTYAGLGVTPGYSDHTPGLAAAVAATALGARVIEKHLTLSNDLPGPDHRASLEPAPFAALVAAVGEAASALGRPDKAPTPSELPNRAVARRTLVARRAIAAGDRFSPDLVAIRRAGAGLEPADLWRLEGRPAQRAYAADALIDPAELAE
jgi:sialic acid synthase SpsE